MSDKVNAIALTGLNSKELTDLSRRCLATRKALNDKKRAGAQSQNLKKKADRIAYLQAELAKLAK